MSRKKKKKDPFFREALEEAKQSINLEEYKSYFFKARSLKRKHTLFVGPTNSGKTYNALNMLAEGYSGAYLSPLRLLAWEGKQELLKRGIKSNIITGEEKETENCNFTSQTIETLNTMQEVDSVLIDEVQMLADKDRGWAWTQAIFGAPAKNIIMTGTPAIVPIIEKIVIEILGEELEVVELERFNELKVLDSVFNYHKFIGPSFESLNKFEIKRLIEEPAGTAFVCFSRNKVLSLKEIFEDYGISCSVIYGNLNPEIRREEAEKFASGETKYLIATDSIGMGLNLPISKVILTTSIKFDGEKERYLTVDEVKQVCGRAGRYGKFENGETSFLFKEGSLEDILEADSYCPDKVFISPSLEHVRYISSLLETNSIKEIYSFFYSTINGDFFKKPRMKEIGANASIIDLYKKLSIDEKYLMMACPVPGENFYKIYKGMLSSFEKKEEYDLLDYSSFSKIFRRTFRGKINHQLMCEFYLKYLNLYHWFSLKLDHLFWENKKAMKYRKEYNNKIKSMLNKKLKKVE